MASDWSRQDYYTVLGVLPTATAEELRAAYKKRALEHHPDKNPGREKEATEIFKLVAEAYDCLRDPRRREEYSRWHHHAENEYDPPQCDAQARQKRPRSEAWRRRSQPGCTLERAMQLFREMFGEAFGDALQQVARAVEPHVQAAGVATMAAAHYVAPHVQAAAEWTAAAVAEGAVLAAPHLQAAVRTTAAAVTSAAEGCGRSAVVRRALSDGLAEIETDAQAEITRLEATFSATSSCLQRRRAELQEHRQACSKLEQGRTLRSAASQGKAEQASLLVIPSLFPLCYVAVAQHPWWVLAPASVVLLLALVLNAALSWLEVLQQRCQNRRLLEEEGSMAEHLRANVGLAEEKLETTRRRLARMRASAEEAGTRMLSVDKEGASMQVAAEVGLHYAGKALKHLFTGF